MDKSTGFKKPKSKPSLEGMKPENRTRKNPQEEQRPQGYGGNLLIKTRAVLHIHLHPQTSKRLHLRFYLGRAEHPERIE